MEKDFISDKSSHGTNLSFFGKNRTYGIRRPSTCQPNHCRRQKNFNSTTGEQISNEVITSLNKMIPDPFKLPKELNSIEEAKRFWKYEKNKKLEERKLSYLDQHTHKTRLNVLWKRERLLGPDQVKLPGKSITDEIDPDFFTMVTGRPIKVKTDTRRYLKDIRDCFLTRLKTGYCLDEILLAEEGYTREKRKLKEVQKNVLNVLKAFEEFLKEDHMSCSVLLENAKKETKISKEKLKIVNSLKQRIHKLEADVLLIEEKWRNYRMFQKFLYTVSPSEWRKEHDPDYTEKGIAAVQSDPCGFNRFMESPDSRKFNLDVKISKFKADLEESQPPVLYFTDPAQLRDILDDLEENNRTVFVLSKDLDFPAEKLMADVEKAKIIFERHQRIVEDEIKYLTDLIQEEEKKIIKSKEKLREIAYGAFKDLITDEEYLTVMAYVEDAFEDTVTKNDNNLNMVSMITQIELKYENLLLALDILPNNIMVRIMKKFYEMEEIEAEEAKDVERKVRRMENLMRRFRKALETPKLRQRRRKATRRSLPLEEPLFKYQLPEILTKKERKHLFFFGRMSQAEELFKPLYA